MRWRNVVTTLWAALLLCTSGVLASPNPLNKVLDLLGQLSAKIKQEGVAEGQAYAEYAAWCKQTSATTRSAVEAASKEKAALEAKIQEAASDISEADGKIAELVSAISAAEAEAKATEVNRGKETAQFHAGEKELVDAVEILNRAVGVLVQEMAKKPAQLQVSGRGLVSALQALSLVVDGAALPADDREKLQSLLQAQLAVGAAPAPALASPGGPFTPFRPPEPLVGKSKGIVEVLESMKETADQQLKKLREAEVAAQASYEKIKANLAAQLAEDAKDLAEQKRAKAEAEGIKATAEGDLQRATQDLDVSQKELETCHHSCLSVAADHEASSQAREGELMALQEAVKILRGMTSGPVDGVAPSRADSNDVAQAGPPAAPSRADAEDTDEVLNDLDFLQASSTALRKRRSRTTRGRARVKATAKVVAFLRSLAKEHRSIAISKLALRISAAAKFGAVSGEDPFGKVKELIQDMIAKLEKEGRTEATEKTYCDGETSRSKGKESELSDRAGKVAAEVDQAAARSAELKEEAQVLETELGELHEEQAELDSIRQEAHQKYLVTKADLESGVGALRKALGILRDYYATASESSLIQEASSEDAEALGSFMRQPKQPAKFKKASGAGSGIIGALEVCESDFASNLAKVETEEGDEQREHDKVTQENKLVLAAKTQDAEHKLSEAASLDKAVAELSNDRDSTETELAAVKEYGQKLKERCEKADKYEDQQRRREAEVQGLQTALTALTGEAMNEEAHHGGIHHEANVREAQEEYATENHLDYLGEREFHQKDVVHHRHQADADAGDEEVAERPEEQERTVMEDGEPAHKDSHDNRDDSEHKEAHVHHHVHQDKDEDAYSQHKSNGEEDESRHLVEDKDDKEGHHHKQTHQEAFLQRRHHRHRRGLWSGEATTFLSAPA